MTLLNMVFSSVSFGLSAVCGIRLPNGCLSSSRTPSITPRHGPSLGPRDRLLPLVPPAAPRTAASSVPSLATAQTPSLPLADSGPQHEPHAVHARISTPGTSLRSSMNHVAYATKLTKTKIRRWLAFTPPRSTALAAHRGLVLHRRAYSSRAQIAGLGCANRSSARGGLRLR
jgi:hypothetical protein